MGALELVAALLLIAPTTRIISAVHLLYLYLIDS